MKFPISTFQNSMLAVIAASTVFTLLYVKDISEQVSLSSYDSRNDIPITYEEALPKATSKEAEASLLITNKEYDKPDPFEGLLKKRISEVESQTTAMPTKITQTPAPSNDAFDDRSCYVTIGNYSQPMFAYDADCNVLSQEMTEKKISLTLNKLPDVLTANFKAEEEKGVIYVFTDYTCPYCKKLHNKIGEFNAKGFTVKYLQYPRILNAAPNSVQASTVMSNMENAWCAPDHRSSFEQLYRTGRIDDYECTKESGRIHPPMREHFALGKQLELKYTPTVVSQDGKVSYGFTSVSRTLRELGK